MSSCDSIAVYLYYKISVNHEKVIVSVRQLKGLSLDTIKMAINFDKSLNLLE